MSLEEKNKIFNNSHRPHVLLITNHGCHAKNITVTTDTGGQNFYVNDLALAFTKKGYKVTILNRGGYSHPITKKRHTGLHYYDDIWKKNGKFCRLQYLEDSKKEFIPKEKLKKSNLEKEKNFIFSKKLKIDDVILISSHYWDAGILGGLIKDELKKRYARKVIHTWTPHSLGILKQKNYQDESASKTEKFNFPSRIQFEEQVIEEADAVVSTSKKIKNTLKEYSSKVKRHLWFPPGIDIETFKPREIEECKDIVKVLARCEDKKTPQIKKILADKKIILEVSRTAPTKRKDLVIDAFSLAKDKDSYLLMAIDKNTSAYNDVLKSYARSDEKERIILLDKQLTKKETAQLFSLANIYMTASVMEGWGMSVQQAAASCSAIISSKYVPFVNEVLKDTTLIARKETAKDFAQKLIKLLSYKKIRQSYANTAYRLIIKNYSWDALLDSFLEGVRLK